MLNFHISKKNKYIYLIIYNYIFLLKKIWNLKLYIFHGLGARTCPAWVAAAYRLQITMELAIGLRPVRPQIAVELAMSFQWRLDDDWDVKSPIHIFTQWPQLIDTPFLPRIERSLKGGGCASSASFPNREWSSSNTIVCTHSISITENISFHQGKQELTQESFASHSKHSCKATAHSMQQ